MSNAGDADSDQTKELRFSKRDSSVSDASEVFPPQLESHLSWKVHKVPGTDLPTAADKSDVGDQSLSPFGH